MKKILLFLSFLLMSIGVLGSTATFTSTNSNPSGGDCTLTVNDITISWNGADNSTDIRVYKGQTLTVTSSAGNITSLNFTYSGSYNGGWNNSYTGLSTMSWSKTTTSGQSGKQARITQLIVTYEGGSTTTYTVSYDANGGSGTMTDSNSPYSSGTTVTVLSNTFTRDGYTFDHWDTKADDSGIDYDADDTFTITANTTLYAQWEEELEEEEFVLHMGDITDDDYIIYYNGKAMNTILDGNRLQYENVTPINHEIITDNKSIVWQISRIPETDYYTIYNEHDEKYVACTNTNNQITLVDNVVDNNAKWTIEIKNDKEYEFINVAHSADDHNKLRNNGTYGFARYADVTGGALTLYKKYDGEGSHIVQWIVSDELFDIQVVNDGLHISTIPDVDVNEYCGDTIIGWTNNKYFGDTLPYIFNTSEESPIIRKDTIFYAVFTSYDNTIDETYHKVSLNDLTDDDIFIIVAKYNDIYYAMSNDNGTENPPVGISINPICDFIFTNKTNILWNITKNSNNYTFYVNGDDTKWLYCTNNNNGVRVGTNANKVFTIKNNYLHNTATSRYLGVYRTNPDWRCYTTYSGSSNIANQTFEFYKRVQNITDFHTACIREFNDSISDGMWKTETNWVNHKLPTSKYTAQINEPVTIDIEHATAKNVIINQNTGNGKIIIQPNKGLEVDSTIVVFKNNSYHPTTPTDLVLESSSAGNASLIFNNNNQNSATVNLYSKATYPGLDGENADWQYIGTSITSLNALYNYYGSWLYEWVGEPNKWQAVPNGGTMRAWKGYCITQQKEACHETSGQLVATNNIVELPIDSPYTVVANSWTAPIHISKFADDDFYNLSDKRIYLFNTGFDPGGDGAVHENRYNSPGTYVVIPIHAASYLDKDSLIPSQQGFFVKTNRNGTLKLDYNKLVRTGGSGLITAGALRAPKRTMSNNKPNVLKIYAHGSKFSDRLTILEREDFSTGFDNGWDGDKMSFSSLSPSIYVINENGSYDEVSAIPDYEGTVLGFKSGSDSICRLTFRYDGDDTWYLNDLVTLTSTLIDSDSEYVFTHDSENDVRFIISATPYAGVATDIDKVSDGENSVHKYLHNGNLYIIKNNRIFNAIGSLIQ